MNAVSRFVLFVIVIIASLPAYSQEPLELERRVDAYISAELEKAKIPGMAVAVIRGGEVFLAKGYGYANLEHRVPVSTDTIFQSGSVGKQFAATLLMLLVEEGKVGLDDPINKYFSDAPAAWAAITVRHLLTHTSGIPEYTSDFDLRRDYSEDELAKFSYGLTLEFPAGTRFNYSNTGYVLLGILIGKASGRFYGEALRERVFQPLGMTTARIISEADIIAHRAAGYRLVDGQINNQEWVSPALNTTADGATYLSLRDFIAWDRGMRMRALLQPPSWDQVYSPVTLASGRTYPYGFGWFVETYAGQTVHLHAGQWQGFCAQISRYLGDDLSVLVLANSAAADVAKISSSIAAIFNPALAASELKPIKDREPRVRERARQLLKDARDNQWSAGEFAYYSDQQLKESAASHQRKLAELGNIETIVLVKRRELGDERVYVYEVRFGNSTQLLRLALTPENKVSGFDLFPKP